MILIFTLAMLLIHFMLICLLATFLFASKEEKRELIFEIKLKLQFYVREFKILYRYYRIQKAVKSSNPVIAIN